MHVNSLDEWVDTVAEFMATDKSNDWSEELSELARLRGNDFIPEGAYCDECGREDRELTRFIDDGTGTHWFLCDRHLTRDS